jgi:hypothetical protein
MAEQTQAAAPHMHQQAPTTASPNPDNLINLADIKEPPLPDSFYLTPLDVVFLLVALFLLLFIAKQLYQRWQAQAPRRAAIQQLNSLAKPSAAEINQLLKRFLRSVTNHHPALTLSGEPWQLFLATTVPNNPHPTPNMTALLYQATVDETAVVAFQHYALHWLKKVNIGALNA